MSPKQLETYAGNYGRLAALYGGPTVVDTYGRANLTLMEAYGDAAARGGRRPDAFVSQPNTMIISDGYFNCTPENQRLADGTPVVRGRLEIHGGSRRRRGVAVASTPRLTASRRVDALRVAASRGVDTAVQSTRSFRADLFARRRPEESFLLHRDVLASSSDVAQRDGPRGGPGVQNPGGRRESAVAGVRAVLRRPRVAGGRAVAEARFLHAAEDGARGAGGRVRADRRAGDGEAGAGGARSEVAPDWILSPKAYPRLARYWQ